MNWSQEWKPKELRGLSVKYLNLFNLSLLGKCIWGTSAKGSNFLSTRYGDLRLIGNINLYLDCWKSSRWWRGMSEIERDYPFFTVGLQKSCYDD